MKSAFIIFLLFISFSALVSAQNAKQGNLEQELLKTQKQLVNAFYNGDIETFKSLISDDFIGFSNVSDGKLSRTDLLNTVTSIKQSGKKYDYTEALTDIQVRDYGDVALLSYISTAMSQILDQNEPDKVRSTEIYRRQNGQWKLAAKHITNLSEIKDPVQ
jgi:ketosteroid isomerase-like protein